MREWLEERTALPGLWKRFADHPVPGGPRVTNVLPAVLVYLFVQEAVLGVLMAAHYSPSSTDAWASTAYLNDQLASGWFIRGLHHYGMSAMLLATVAFFRRQSQLHAFGRSIGLDQVLKVMALTSISFPEFFVAYILIFVLAQSGWFPSMARMDASTTFTEALYRTFLPALTLTLVVTAHMMRMTRAALINLLASPYIEMARLKGMSPARVILKHALPNALAPIITVVALNLAYLITGVVVVEAVFVYPGLGQLMVDSVSKRDFPVVQAVALIFAAAYVLLNLTADVLSTLSNPRLIHRK